MCGSKICVMRASQESHLAYPMVIFLGRQMKQKVERKKKTRVKAASAKLPCSLREAGLEEFSSALAITGVLMCTERWISCLVGITKQVLSGNSSESRLYRRRHVHDGTLQQG